MTEKMTGRTLPLLIYFLIGIPLEFLGTFLNIHQLKYAHWLLLLNLGTLVQAFVVIAFLLGLRSVLAREMESSTGATPVARRSLLIILGIVVGLLTAWAWWQLFRYATHLSGEQDYIFGRRPFSLGYYPGTLSGGIDFALARSVFVALCLGITGGELAARWSPKRRLFGWAMARSNRAELTWELWVTWFVVYRLSSMIVYSLAFWGSAGTGSAEAALIYAAPSLATALLCIPVSSWIAGHPPATKKSAIRGSLGAGLLINLLAAMLLLPLGFLAIAMILSPLSYIPVLVWGWLAGELRWRSFQPQPLASAAK